MILLPRLKGMLRALMAVDTPVTGEYLAGLVHVTSRTIRNDLKELNALLQEHGAGIHSIRAAGYELTVQNKEKFQCFLKEMAGEKEDEESFIPNTHEERVSYLIKRLLLEENYVKIDDLADELYVSKSTLQNDLHTVKNQFKQYEISLKTKPGYGFKVYGDEMKLRYCMSEYIFNRSVPNMETGYADLAVFPSKEQDIIRESVLQYVSEYEIALSDIALSNLIVHIFIAYKRIKESNYIHLLPEELSDITNEKEYEAATKIVNQIEKKLGYHFPDHEIAYIAIHLLGTKWIIKQPDGLSEIKAIITPELSHLIDEMMDAVEDEYHLGISEDEEFLTNIMLHLKPAMNRIKYGMNLRNPLLNDIKKNYPMAFEASVTACSIIQEKTGFSIDENEIGYIALHIGAAIERKKINTKPKKCIIVCASGVGSSRLLYYKLQSVFGSKLEIMETTEYYKLKQYSLREIDFIISTIPIHETLLVPVIEVNTILHEQDYKKIQKMIGKDSTSQNKFLKQSLVFLKKDFQTREEVLLYLGNELKQQGIVGDGFIESVFKREELAPTSFGNFAAIPHPLVPQTNKTFWAICTLKKPVMWGDKPVQFICLLSLKKNNKEDLQEMYKQLIAVIENPSFVKRLLKCDDRKEIIKHLS